MKRPWLRRIEIFCVVTLCVALGCSQITQVPLEDELPPGQGAPSVLIDGFTVRDGSKIRVRGYAEVVGDSFFVYREGALRGTESGRLVALPRSQVRLLHYRVPDKEGTVELVVTLTLAAVLVAALILKSELDKPWLYK